MRPWSGALTRRGEQGADFGGVVVKAGSPIKTAEDLAGKRVAVDALKGVNDTTVRVSVRAAGGDPARVEFTELAFPDMLAALDRGDVDAVQFVEPFLAAALKDRHRLVASNYVDTAPDLALAGYFTSERTAEEKPETVRKFAAAMRKSLKYATDNPGAVREVLPTYTRIDAGIAGDLTLPAFPAQVDRASLETLTNLAVQDGLIELTAASAAAGLLP